MTELYFAYCQGDILLTSEGEIPFGDSAPVEFQPWEHVTDIVQGERQCHIYRLDNPVTNRPDLQMVGLRKTFDILPSDLYQLAGKCAELVYWDQNSKYCGCCGAPMKWHTEISKHCTECGKEIWPQLQTAIIVRVTRGDEVLMVHAHNFRREVWEETHLKVKNVRYFASQPWPYPAGLMVGFTADYDGGELKLQRSELGGGGWFRRDNLPEMPNRSSLARQLIDDWLINK